MSDTDRSGIGIDPGFYLAVLSSAITGSDEITEMGRPLPENTGISLGMQVESREFIAGQPIKLRETELEHISFTIQHLIAPEIRRVLVERPTGS